MKRLLSVGLLAICALALSQHQAHAWVNSRFSIGLNWHHQSANTSYLWGLWRNGQVPGPEAFGGGGPGGPGGPGMGAPGPQSQPFPFFGANGQGGTQQGMYQPAYQPNMQPSGVGMPAGMPNGFPPAFQFDTAPANVQKLAQQPAYNPYFNNPYQTVNYQPSAYTQPLMYYPSSAYYHPYYNMGQGYEAPFYWYSYQR